MHKVDKINLLHILNKMSHFKHKNTCNHKTIIFVLLAIFFWQGIAFSQDVHDSSSLKVPPNAYVSGDRWFCKSGFRRSGEQCLAFKVPPTNKSGNKLKSFQTGKPNYPFSSGGGGGSYDYDVSGYDSDGNYIYGNVDADGGSDVDGYIYTEDGESKYFYGEWVGNGEIEGYDEDGNYLNLETD